MARELLDIAQYRHVALREPWSRAPVRLNRLGKITIECLDTQKLRVRLRSVEARIQRRDRGGDQLVLAA